MLHILSTNWWTLAIRGGIAILFGVIVLLAPAIALEALVLLWGAYALSDGILSVWAGLKGHGKHQHWWVSVLEGVVSIFAGLAAVMWPGLTALVLLYIIAAWAIFTGVTELFAALQLRKEIAGELWLALSGVVSILFGALLFFAPGTGILAVLWILAFYAIAFGAFLLVLSFRLKTHHDRMHHQQHQPA